MGIMLIIAIMIIALLVFVICIAVKSARERNYSRLVMSIVAFLLFVCVIAYGMTRFITSM